MRTKIEISDLRFPRYGCVVVADCDDTEGAVRHFMNIPDVGLLWQDSDKPNHAEGTFFVIVPLETDSREPLNILTAMAKVLTRNCSCEWCKQLRDDIEAGTFKPTPACLSLYEPKAQQRYMAKAREMLLVAKEGSLN